MPKELFRDAHVETADFAYISVMRTNSAHCQPLEPRRLLAGDVQVFFETGFLSIAGDSQDNAVRLDVDGDLLRIRGLEGTTLNGGTDSITLPAALSTVAVDLAGGRDQLLIDGLSFGTARANIDAGDGRDSVLIRNTRLGEIFHSGGLGIDWLGIHDSDIGALNGSGGGDRDTLDIRRSSVRGDLLWNDRSGPGGAFIQGTQIGGDLELASVDETQSFNVWAELRDNTIEGAAGLSSGGGDDRLIMRNNLFSGGQPIVNSAGGADILDRDIVIEWDFEDGDQGWEAGFADYHPNFEIDGLGRPVDPDDPETDIWDLDWGVRDLPAEVRSGASRAGFFVQSMNRSDDIFSYLRKPLGSADGVAANQAYTIQFDITFASNVPAGLGGIGGAPAESVFLKVGASADEPRTIADNSADPPSPLSLDKGNQGTGGSELSIVGDIRNGATPPEQGDFDNLPYRLVRRVHEHSEPITSGADGTLWLAAGTDSGFEGLTALYYDRIRASLVPVG